MQVNNFTKIIVKCICQVVSRYDTQILAFFNYMPPKK